MEWKIIIANFLGAFIIFLIWFVTALLSGWAFDKSGDYNKLVLVVNILLIFGLFVGATVRSSIEISQSKEVKGTPQNIKPDISCLMEYPIKVENDKYFRNKRNPDIVVKNNGPINVVSVSCDIKIYGYDLAKNKIIRFVDTGFRSFDHAFSAQELKPFDELRHSTIGLPGKDVLAIYVVKVNYHRKSDMEPFTLEEYFFTENQKIMDNNDFKKDERYNRIIEMVKTYQPPREDALTINVTAADDHTWFMEADNWLSAKRGLDGKIKIVGLPKEQEETPQNGYPYLDIKPKPFKATGFYTEAQIVGDHIEVKIPFEVKNIGDEAAIITEDGLAPIITIEPNQTKYYTKTIMVGKRKKNRQPLENFIKLIDNEDKVLQLKFSILYRPGNDKEKLFKSTVHYEIGKNKVMPIKK